MFVPKSLCASEYALHAGACFWYMYVSSCSSSCRSSSLCLLCLLCLCVFMLFICRLVLFIHSVCLQN